MPYQTKVIDFDDDRDRTEKFDQWMQAPGNEGICIRDAVMVSDQAMIIYDQNDDGDTVRPVYRQR